jgi:hypothetical protein
MKNVVDMWAKLKMQKLIFKPLQESTFPSICLWQRKELTIPHRGGQAKRLSCLRSRGREEKRQIIQAISGFTIDVY